MVKQKKGEDKSKKIHFFLSGEDVKKIEILQKANNTRFATDVVKQALDAYLFYLWLEEKKFKEFAKLVEEFKRDVEKHRRKSRKEKLKASEFDTIL
jgi:predicted transcriptional regulator